MKIKYRLLILGIQLALLFGFTYWATGKIFSSENWFFAGLLAVIINPQLLEPFYPKPADIVGNCFITLLLCLVTTKTILYTGWIIYTWLLITIIILALISMIFGSQKQQNNLSKFAQAARIISSEATSLRIYSIAFWFLLIEAFRFSDPKFWIIGSSWLLIVIITLIDWKRIFITLNTFSGNVTVEGMISPSILLVSSSNIPMPGKLVSIKTNVSSLQGVVISRIRRLDDVWGQVSIASQGDCESILNAGSINLSEITCDENLIGSIEEGSTESTLIFHPTNKLEIGEVVTVLQEDKEIMYQVSSARVHQTDIKGGSYFHTVAKALQIGVFNPQTNRIEGYRWVPNLGSKLVHKENKPQINHDTIPETWFEIGNILGTEVPIFIDSDIASEGHLVILGMTKMGKSTLANRYSNFLGTNNCVTILDQTGEYINKKKMSPFDSGHLNSPNDVKVLEPKLGNILPDFAKDFLRDVVNHGRLEYEKGEPLKRIVIIDEAHQFIPEPAIIGFGAEGRESAIYIGNLMMQVRKYGVSMVLISQRTAVVAKSALSQCENIIAFKSTDHTGLDYLESIVGNQVREILPKLRQGEALVYGPAFTSNNPIIVKVKNE